MRSRPHTRATLLRPPVGAWYHLIPSSLSRYCRCCDSPRAKLKDSFMSVACLIPPARSSAINERKSYNVTQSRPRARTRPLISKGFLRLTVTSFPSLRHTLPRRARPPPTRIKREVLRNSTNLRLATAGRSVRCLRHLRAGKRLLFIGSNKAEDDCSWQILPEEEKPPAERTLSYFA